MERQFRHTHIAIRRSIADLAAHCRAVLHSGEDDLGRFAFFDLHVIDEDEERSFLMRFASHEFDSMTHVLSESDDSLDAAGAAITSLGVGMDDLSISVDPTKRPMLDPAVLDAMLKMMEVVSTGGKKRERKKIDRVPATSGAKAGSGHGALFPVSISNETGRHFYRLAVGT